MNSKEKVYDAFAELIYSVVMADGRIDEHERVAIVKIVKEHPIGADIQRYFNSNNKEVSIAQCFLHTLEVCKKHGKDVEYSFLLNIVEEIAKVSEGLGNDSLFIPFVKNFKKRFLSN